MNSGERVRCKLRELGAALAEVAADGTWCNESSSSWTDWLQKQGIPSGVSSEVITRWAEDDRDRLQVATEQVEAVREQLELLVSSQALDVLAEQFTAAGFAQLALAQRSFQVAAIYQARAVAESGVR